MHCLSASELKIVNSNYVFGLPANSQLTAAGYDVHIMSVVGLSWRISVGPIIVHWVTKCDRLVDAVGSLPDVGFARYINGWCPRVAQRKVKVSCKFIENSLTSVIVGCDKRNRA
jgi:hypothetical protein